MTASATATATATVGASLLANAADAARRPGQFASKLAPTVAGLLLLAGCVSVPNHAEREATTNSVASGWTPLRLNTSTFTLAAWVPPPRPPSTLLTVYIEGDGFAWQSAQTPSPDPTPINPTGLRLAVAQPTGAVAYLARPCQYLNDPHCTQAYWTDQRFAPSVIDASNQALDQLKARAGANRLLLVGFSGGGAVVALLAERRNDIAGLITVAGNLDPNAWTALHHVSPLTGSMDPTLDKARLASLPQWHFVGGSDENIPAPLARHFVQGLPHAQVIVREGFSHKCCWPQDWPSLFTPIYSTLNDKDTAQ